MHCCFVYTPYNIIIISILCQKALLDISVIIMAAGFLCLSNQDIEESSVVIVMVAKYKKEYV